MVAKGVFSKQSIEIVDVFISLICLGRIFELVMRCYSSGYSVSGALIRIKNLTLLKGG